MSNRNSQNRQDGNYRHGRNKGFSNTQKYVPKPNPNSVPRESQPTPTLSGSLRKSFSRQSDEPATSSSGSNGLPSAVRLRESEGSASRRVEGGKFVNYLPQDEAVAAGLGAEEGGLDPVESQGVVDHLNRELSRLLKLRSREFWREVASDSSLVSFLDGFLQFRNRWFDFPYRGVKGGIVAGVIVGESELSRRVFMLLYRISSNRDPSGKAGDTLSPKDHSALLQEKKFLDLPKLLDICAIYGHENQDLTRSLVVNAIKSQPWVHDDFVAALSHCLTIVHTMHQRCSASLEVLFSSQGSEDHGSHRLDADYLEVMDFINDAIVSMDALVSAYKPAAVFFSCLVETSYGSKDLLSTVATLHDSLLPSLRRGLELIFTSRSDELKERSGDMHSNIRLSLKMLSVRIAEFGWKLLDVCYLSDEVFKSNFPLPAVTKMVPANVEDPVIRADILVQTLREISGGSLPEAGQNSRTFLQNVEKNHKILDSVQLLQSTGWILMDDEQFQYLSRIMKHDSEGSRRDMFPSVSTSQTGKTTQVDEDSAIVESRISQIKDIFPDFGKGFISACLEAYNQNPEDVIQRILEGTLHEDLQALDTSLEMVPPAKSAPVSRNDKGKGKLLEPAPPSAVNVGPTVGPSPSSSSSSSAGRFVRKSTSTNTSSVLDSRDERNLAKTAALISQMEYEDEYDDSFDDLGTGVADSGGLEETEILGDKINVNREKPWEAQSGSSGPSGSNSRWNSQKRPQFYVKDGKNYSYKVSGSVAVANYNDAVIVNEAQKELIHGLGRGGNLPMGAVKRMEQANEEYGDEPECGTEGEGGRGYHGNPRGRGRRGGGRRGRSNFRKDQAWKKHLRSGPGGF